MKYVVLPIRDTEATFGNPVYRAFELFRSELKLLSETGSNNQAIVHRQVERIAKMRGKPTKEN